MSGHDDEALEAGQVWEWTIGEEPYRHVREIYLLLRALPCDLKSYETFVARDRVRWEALCLETGALDVIHPMITAGFWERIG